MCAQRTAPPVGKNLTLRSFLRFISTWIVRWNYNTIFSDLDSRYVFFFLFKLQVLQFLDLFEHYWYSHPHMVRFRVWTRDLPTCCSQRSLSYCWSLADTPSSSTFARYLQFSGPDHTRVCVISCPFASWQGRCLQFAAFSHSGSTSLGWSQHWSSCALELGTSSLCIAGAAGTLLGALLLCPIPCHWSQQAESDWVWSPHFDCQGKPWDDCRPF